MNVKTNFLNGESEEEIYMQQLGVLLFWAKSKMFLNFKNLYMALQWNLKFIKWPSRMILND